MASIRNLLYLPCPGRVGPSRVFGYLRSSAKTRITRAITNRQSMAMEMATRVQDDFSSNVLTSYDHPMDEDPSAGTPVWHGPQVVLAACGPTARSSGPIFRHRFPHTQKKRDQFIGWNLIGSVRTVTCVGHAPGPSTETCCPERRQGCNSGAISL